MKTNNRAGFDKGEQAGKKEKNIFLREHARLLKTAEYIYCLLATFTDVYVYDSYTKLDVQLCYFPQAVKPQKCSLIKRVLSTLRQKLYSLLKRLPLVLIILY